MADKNAPAAETKADRFKRLAIARTNKALDAIANIGGLANKGNYEYDDEAAKKILQALEGEVVKLAAKFTNPTATATEGFTL